MTKWQLNKTANIIIVKAHLKGSRSVWDVQHFSCIFQSLEGIAEKCIISLVITRNNTLYQPFSIFIRWRNPWNNCQVSGNSCIRIIISTAHGTLAWSVSCRYNNPIIIVNALLSKELYFSVDLFILAKFKKLCLFFFNHDLSRNPRVPRNPGWETLHYINQCKTLREQNEI
jgi:hypothetical protein